MDDTGPSRREFGRALGTALPTSLAGCTDDDEGHPPDGSATEVQDPAQPDADAVETTDDTPGDHTSRDDDPDDDGGTDRGTTAWRDGEFVVDTASVVGRSDIVLDAPPVEPAWSMGIGNGHVGAAVWAENGFTAQLNPNHTVGYEWKSAGHVTVPDLSALSEAEDYSGRVDLYDGVFRQSGDGITAESYVHATAKGNLFVVDVTGFDPDAECSVELRFEDDRNPDLATTAHAAVFTESWEGDGDDRFIGSTDDEWTWSLAGALAVDGRGPTAERIDEHTVAVQFRPASDGSFRLFVSLPPYPGEALDEAVDAALDAVAAGAEQSSAELRSTHTAWWHEFWEEVNLLRLHSEDGAAAFHENARTLGLYYLASMNRGVVPGHHAGEGHLFRYQGDHMDWLGLSNGYWHFNARLQVLAALPAGLADLNEPFFRLYRENLDRRKRVTRREMRGRDVTGDPGAAIPEVMTQAGEGDWQLTGDPWYTARINSTGGEVAHLLWLQYLYTGDEEFLEANYPVIAETVRFLLAYAREDDTGTLYMEPSNAHETQWDTRNPATDVAAMQALFPLAADLASRFGDDDLAARLEAALPKVPDLPRDGDTLAWSELDLAWENTVNVELEPIYPWGLFDDSGDDRTELARRTFADRTFHLGGNVDGHPPKAWTLEPAQAARLGLTGTFRSLMEEAARAFHTYRPDGELPSGLPSGMLAQTLGNPYVEWLGAQTCALQEAAIQSYDGLVRIAPAWPPEWDGALALDVRGNHRVVTQIRDGVPKYVGIQARRDDTVRIRNPWPGREVRVVDGGFDPTDAAGAPTVVVDPIAEDTLTIDVEAGRSYVLERTAVPLTSFGFEPITAERNQSPRVFEAARIGLPRTVELSPSQPSVVEQTPGAEATVEVTVENTGTARSGETTVRLLDVTDDEPTPIDDRVVPSIPPESRTDVTFAWEIGAYAAGTERALVAVVDPDGQRVRRESDRTTVRIYGPLPEEYESYASTDARFGTWGDHVVIDANGEEVWRTIDEYGAVYRAGERIGDEATAIAKVVSQEHTSDWANAGLMLRNDVSEAGSATGYAHVAATPRYGFMFEWDSSGDGYVDERATAGTPTYPCWLKLEKRGDTVTGSYSTDGETWRAVGSATIREAAEAQDVALFVTSGTSDETSIAEFDDFRVSSP